MKDYLKVSAGVAIFIAAILGLLTAIRSFNRQPSVILTSTECSPPCWYGLYPGQSSASHVYEMLGTLDGIDRDSIMEEYDRDHVLTKIYWFFERPVEDGMGTVHIEDDRVTAVTIFTLNSLRLTDLFDVLGQPDEYWTEIGYGENREYLEVTLLYPTKGYVVEVVIDTAAGLNHVEIAPNTPVFRVTYFAPEMYPELLRTTALIDKSAIARTGAFQPWTGFGSINFERK